MHPLSPFTVSEIRMCLIIGHVEECGTGDFLSGLLLASSCQAVWPSRPHSWLRNICLSLPEWTDVQQLLTMQQSVRERGGNDTQSKRPVKHTCWAESHFRFWRGSWGKDSSDWRWPCISKWLYMLCDQGGWQLRPRCELLEGMVPSHLQGYKGRRWGFPPIPSAGKLSPRVKRSGPMQAYFNLSLFLAVFRWQSW